MKLEAKFFQAGLKRLDFWIEKPKRLIITLSKSLRIAGRFSNKFSLYRSIKTFSAF